MNLAKLRLVPLLIVIVFSLLVPVMGQKVKITNVSSLGQVDFNSTQRVEVRVEFSGAPQGAGLIVSLGDNETGQYLTGKAVASVLPCYKVGEGKTACGILLGQKTAGIEVIVFDFTVTRGSGNWKLVVYAGLIGTVDQLGTWGDWYYFSVMIVGGPITTSATSLAATSPIVPTSVHSTLTQSTTTSIAALTQSKTESHQNPLLTPIFNEIVVVIALVALVAAGLLLALHRKTRRVPKQTRKQPKRM